MPSKTPDIESIGTLTDAVLMPVATHDFTVDSYSIEAGALLAVPIYETHRRGKNWFATIAKDPAQPGGLARKFHRKANGKYFYMTNDVKLYDAIEFGADYYTGGGNPHRKREHAVVTSLDDDLMALEFYDNPDHALLRSHALKKWQQETQPAQAPESPLSLLIAAENVELSPAQLQRLLNAFVEITGKPIEEITLQYGLRETVVYPPFDFPEAD